VPNPRETKKLMPTFFYSLKLHSVFCRIYNFENHFIKAFPENSTTKARDARRITTAEMKYMGRTADTLGQIIKQI
jgi:hypothetical protein